MYDFSSKNSNQNIFQDLRLGINKERIKRLCKWTESVVWVEDCQVYPIKMPYFVHWPTRKQFIFSISKSCLLELVTISYIKQTSIHKQINLTNTKIKILYYSFSCIEATIVFLMWGLIVRCHMHLIKSKVCGKNNSLWRIIFHTILV